MKGSWKVRLALGTVGKILMTAVNKASKNCAVSEEKTLRGILQFARSSEWGQAHNFDHIDTGYEIAIKNTKPLPTKAERKKLKEEMLRRRALENAGEVEKKE